MTEWTSLLLGLGIVLFAGFTQGLTSFGFALIALPFLSQLVPLNQAVPLVVMLSLGTNLLVMAQCWKDVELKKIWILIVCGLLAAPLGTLLLLVIAAPLLKLAAGILIAAFALLLLLGKSFPIRQEKLAFIPVGILSGLLNGSISMSGPPVALFLTNQNVSKQTFRANITAYAIILNIITIVSFGLGGLITPAVTTSLMWFLPSMVAGVILGIVALRWIDDALFKKIALGLILVSAIWTMAGALRLH